MKIESIVFSTIMVVFVSCSQASEPSPKGRNSHHRKGFWIFSRQEKPAPPDKIGAQVRAMKKLNVFDYVTIFEMEDTMHQYAEEAFNLKNRFRERERIIMEERSSFISELDSLIKEQDSGRNRTEEVLRVYKKLYQNTKKMHELGIEHSQDLQKLSQDIFKDYISHVDKHMIKYNQNPDELANMLVEKYKDIKSKQKKASR
ncbi:MAG: hypothetical protein ACRC9L_00220 [Brevinema sp.]